MDCGGCSCCNTLRDLLDDRIVAQEQIARLKKEVESWKARAEVLHEEIQTSTPSDASRSMRERAAGRAFTVLIASGYPVETAKMVKEDLLRMEAI